MSRILIKNPLAVATMNDNKNEFNGEEQVLNLRLDKKGFTDEQEKCNNPVLQGWGNRQNSDYEGLANDLHTGRCCI